MHLPRSLRTAACSALGTILIAAALLGQDADETVSRREVLLRAARNLVQARRYEDAIAYFRDYTAQWPDDVPVTLEFAGVLLQAHRVEEAIPLLQRLLEREPENRKALDLLVDACMMKKDFASAASLLERAVARYPDDVELHRELADAYTWLGRYDDALKQYRLLLATAAAGAPGSGDAELRKRLLDILYWAGRHDEYLAESADYLKDNPGDIAVRLTRADLYSARRDFAAAAEECRGVLAIQPDNRIARARLAQFLAWLGRREEAIRAYQQALALAPDDLGLRREYGQTLLWSGRYDEALLTYRKLHARLPDDESITREYLEVAAGAKVVPEAEKAFIRKVYEERFLKEAPLQPRTVAALARALRNAGRLEEALSVFRRAVEAAPRDVALRLQYADLLAALGNAQEAEKEYEFLLESVGRTTREKSP